MYHFPILKAQLYLKLFTILFTTFFERKYVFSYFGGTTYKSIHAENFHSQENMKERKEKHTLYQTLIII